MNVLRHAADGSASASHGNEPQVGVFLDGNYVAASSSCAVIDNTYLYVARPLDPRVVPQLRATAGERQPNMPTSAVAALRRPDRLRADVHGDRA